MFLSKLTFANMLSVCLQSMSNRVHTLVVNKGRLNTPSKFTWNIGNLGKSRNNLLSSNNSFPAYPRAGTKSSWCTHFAETILRQKYLVLFFFSPGSSVQKSKPCILHVCAINKEPQSFFCKRMSCHILWPRLGQNCLITRCNIEYFINRDFAPLKYIVSRSTNSSTTSGNSSSVLRRLSKYSSSTCEVGDRIKTNIKSKSNGTTHAAMTLEYPRLLKNLSVSLLHLAFEATNKAVATKFKLCAPSFSFSLCLLLCTNCRRKTVIGPQDFIKRPRHGMERSPTGLLNKIPEAMAVALLLSRLESKKL